MADHIPSLLRQVEAKRAALASIDAEAGDKPLTPEQQTQWDAAKTEHDSFSARLEQAQLVEKTRIAKVGDRPIVTQDEGDKPFGESFTERFGAQMHAIYRAEPRVGGGKVDARLLKLRTAAATGSNEADGGSGGFLLEAQTTSDILKIVFASANLASRCNRIPIAAGSNSLTYKKVLETSRVAGSRWGGVLAYWVGEAGSATAKKPVFGEENLKLQKVMGLWYATDELLEDVVAMGTIGAQAFGEEIAFLLDEAIYRGTGAGQPLGFMNSGALVSVAKESGQDADTIYFENVTKMLARLTPGSYGRSVWLVNADCLPTLMAMTVGGAIGSTPVWMPANGAADSPYGVLFGRPVLVNEHSATVGDLGDIMLVDLGYYLLIDKGGVNAAASIHVNFVYDETAFRFTYRVNGAPMLSSAITPAQGSNTLSPFVALAERA